MYVLYYTNFYIGCFNDARKNEKRERGGKVQSLYVCAVDAADICYELMMSFKDNPFFVKLTHKRRPCMQE